MTTITILSTSASTNELISDFLCEFTYPYTVTDDKFGKSIFEVDVKALADDDAEAFFFKVRHAVRDALIQVFAWNYSPAMDFTNDDCIAVLTEPGETFESATYSSQVTAGRFTGEYNDQGWPIIKMIADDDDGTYPRRMTRKAVNPAATRQMTLPEDLMNDQINDMIESETKKQAQAVAGIATLAFVSNHHRDLVAAQKMLFMLNSLQRTLLIGKQNPENLIYLALGELCNLSPMETADPGEMIEYRAKRAAQVKKIRLIGDYLIDTKGNFPLSVILTSIY